MHHLGSSHLDYKINVHARIDLQRKELYLQRHMRRDVVKGSLGVWLTKQQSSFDAITGYKCEEIEDENDPNVESFTNSAEMEIHSTVDDDESLVAPGYIRDVWTSVKPMTNKHISNIMSTVKDIYNSCDSDMQFEIGDLCLKIQELLMS